MESLLSSLAEQMAIEFSRRLDDGPSNISAILASVASSSVVDCCPLSCPVEASC